MHTRTAAASRCQSQYCITLAVITPIINNMLRSNSSDTHTSARHCAVVLCQNNDTGITVLLHVRKSQQLQHAHLKQHACTADKSKAAATVATITAHNILTETHFCIIIYVFFFEALAAHRRNEKPKKRAPFSMWW
jgi:hypothetical protein